MYTKRETTWECISLGEHQDSKDYLPKDLPMSTNVELASIFCGHKFYFIFLVASTQLYKRVCPSVCPCPSVMRSFSDEPNMSENELAVTTRRAETASNIWLCLKTCFRPKCSLANILFIDL